MGSTPLTERLRETLALFEDGTPRTTSEVADRLDIGRRSTYERLERLVDHGELRTKKVGASARVWWRARSADEASPDPAGDPNPDEGDPGDADDGKGDGTPTDVAASDEGTPGGPATGAVVTDDAPEEGSSGRPARSTDLERYETIVETMDDGVYVVDAAGRFTMVNEAYAAMLGYDPEDLVGRPATDVVDDETAREAEAVHRRLASGAADTARLEAELTGADGESRVAEATFALIDPGSDGPSDRVGVVRDVTERTERERELRDRVRQQAVVADLGQRALEDRDLDALLAEAVELVADTLDVDYCKVLDLDPDAEELLLRQGVGWHDGIVGTATVSAVENDSQAAYTLATDEPVVVEDLATESRFGGPDLLTDHDVRSGISTIIGPSDDPWGILGTHDTAPRTFSEHDVSFVQAVANILATAVERRDHERERGRQREQLAALNSLNGVVNGIIDTVLEQSTREEIEQAVCERLAASDSYLFAWTGETNVASRTVSVRAAAGVGDYLDGITISVDPDDPRSGGATGRALLTGTVQTTQDIDADERYAPWRDHVEQYGVQSSAAIPIVHEGTVYGVLNVYADRQNAFEGEERAVVARLGEVVGHAIAATDRKRALMGDEAVELEFHIPDLFAELGTDAIGAGTITIDHTVPLEGGDFAVYGRATADARASVEALAATLPHWRDVTFRDDAGDTRFEARLADAPVLSVVASLGGSVEEAVVEAGDYRLTVHLSPSVDVRRVIDAVGETYPSAEMVKRRQVARDDGDDRVRHVLREELTDRQRTVLQAAYYAGFFEWPREASGEDVAASLDISSSTFHQHLRKAEQRILASLLTSGE